MFKLNGQDLEPLFSDVGTQDLVRFGKSPYYLISTYSGQFLVQQVKHKFKTIEKLDYGTFPKFEYDEENNCVWAKGYYNSILKVDLNSENRLDYKVYATVHNFFKGQNGKLLFYDNQEILAFDKGHFVPFSVLPFTMIKGPDISALDFEDNYVAYVQNGYPYLLSNLFDGHFYSYDKLLSSLKNKLLDPYTFIALKDGELRVATERGVSTFSINSKTQVPVAKSVISKVIVSENSSSTAYLYPYISDALELPKGDKDLIFFFGSNKSSSDLSEYRYRLLPFESQWSPWTSLRDMKEYSQIKGGEYEFQLECRLNGGEVMTNSIALVIDTYWYQTHWIFLPILLFLLVLGYGFIKIMDRRNEKQLRKEKKAHKDELAVKTLGFKNEQLLQYTEVISEKNEFLSQLKDALSRMRNADAKRWENKIEEEVNKEKKNFLFHKLFSEVHQDFINRLTELHHELTPNDIRVISFIRINLGTKEIANLMNISPKSVDITRYRIRKKLSLSHEEDLNKYIRDI